MSSLIFVAPNHCWQITPIFCSVVNMKWIYFTLKRIFGIFETWIFIKAFQFWINESIDQSCAKLHYTKYGPWDDASFWTVAMGLLKTSIENQGTCSEKIQQFDIAEIFLYFMKYQFKIDWKLKISNHHFLTMIRHCQSITDLI